MSRELYFILSARQEVLIIKRFFYFIFWGPRSEPSRRLFAMGRAEAMVAPTN